VASPPPGGIANLKKQPMPPLLLSQNTKVELMSSAPSTAKPEVSFVQRRQIERTAVSADRALLGMDEFASMISRERKRSDRSGKGFVLMLVESRALFGQVKTSQKLATALLSCVRDTDLAGWHRERQMIGVIFTEIATDSSEATIKILRERVAEALREHLNVEQLLQVRISYYYYPEASSTRDAGNKDISVIYPDLTSKQESKKAWFSLKRAIDVVGSLLALVLGSPVFLLIALATKLTSPGPVFFRQTRVGQYGIPFTFLKFRSMFVNCDSAIHKQYVQQLIAGRAERMPSENAKEGVYKLTKDSRITPIGSFLRRTSLDELPQFINVLRGEMSLVGPRPAVVYEVEAYDFWHRNRILEVKPGITGLWQVNGRSRVKFDDMVRLDLRYARSSSLWLDLKILIMTPFAVVFGEGAY
jgi:lipopolysaccharide/colanic/teichoic acid biosynthesis glycosyltransferase